LILGAGIDIIEVERIEAAHRNREYRMSDVCPKRRQSGRKRSALLFFLAMFVVGLLASPQATMASAILGLRSSNELYLAEDGMVTRKLGGPSKSIKCHPISEDCVAGILGFGGAENDLETLDLVADLRYISTEQLAKHQGAIQSMTNVMSQFDGYYNHVIMIPELRGYAESNNTGLFFAGYDEKDHKDFFEAVAIYTPPNSNGPSLDVYSVPDRFVIIMGKTNFFASMLLGRDPRLVSPESLRLTMTLSNFENFKPLETLATTNFPSLLLTMFRLQSTYAVKNSYEGGVGPPYIVYRITPTNVTQVYYGNGATDSDELVVGTLLSAIVTVLVVGLLIIALKM
jgi:hypothetical protein